MSAAITVQNVSKKYIIRHQHESYQTLSEKVPATLKKIIKGDFKRPSSEEFWALQNVTFNINKGDRVGIIGRNGAGKSTLLKILSRIVAPTTGKIEITGNVASLLEIGTGFHAELSGRENIFLNGSILGMSKNEIKQKFDAIVEFSEVEQFLDMPVKRYSSGMFVKLAFAVAAHMNPDILILDEVLAVGDAAFQKKCIAKINDLSHSEGRTVLFVSHSISSIRSICNTAIYLEKGNLMDFGPIDKVIPKYQGYFKENIVKGINVTVDILSPSGEWEVGTDISVTVSWEKHRFAPGWCCDIACYTLDGIKLFALQSQFFKEFSSSDPDSNAINFLVKNIGFVNTDMRMDVGIRKTESEPYSVVIENCAIVSPSDKNLPLYKRTDVITIPEAKCKALKL